MSFENIIGSVLGKASALIPGAARARCARIFDAGTGLVERILGVADPLVPPLRLRLHVGPFLDPRVYKVSAERNLEALQALCSLVPTTRFLDIGCGCGRLASALVAVIEPPGSYEGFDTAEEPIEWCRRHIGSRFPNFGFRATDTFSLRYNPYGASEAEELTFPYADDYFDIVFAGSVYTHMLPGEVSNFISESRRVLRPGGISFATFCLLTDRSLPLVKAGKSSPPLPYVFGDCMVRDPNDPASFIAQPEGFVRSCFTNSGFQFLGPIRYGSWVGRERLPELLEPYGFDQDIIVAQKLDRI